jgi:broad specificity phosphatase PhoE
MALWEVIDQYEWIGSATLTGSFLSGQALEGISDIDLVLVVDRLNTERFETLQAAFRAALTPVLKQEGYALRINPTLGPLKFNDPDTAVLHMMVYSQHAHVDHVVDSPFTCYDWQRSPLHRKLALADVYPVFGLQPRHFLGARRGAGEYLRDYRARIVSYRELQTTADGYREVRCEKPMSLRDRHEFAFHIMRFLMRNLLKLVNHDNDAPEGGLLLDGYFALFPADAEDFRTLYEELSRKKKALDFQGELAGLDDRLEGFVAAFGSQFRRAFQDDATRHIMFRHAPTELSQGEGKEVTFLGRSDPSIFAGEPGGLSAVVEAVRQIQPRKAWVSPLRRCRESLALLAQAVQLPRAETDSRLVEIDYGTCERLTVKQAQTAHPELFSAWQRGEDPPFPGGETTNDVLRRVTSFVAEHWTESSGNTVACTHNVVLRCLVGTALGVPAPSWHRLRIPHMQPICFVQTRNHGWFVDLDPDVERSLFAGFRPEEHTCR